MQIAIIQFPGSNCERETIQAVKRAGMEPVEFLWNESPEKLAACAGYIIVGGFSYEDRSRSGAIAALDPIMRILKEQNKLGKPILGICNGAQILVESGLVPGIENDAIGISLTDNKRVQNEKVLGTGFYNAWINMRVSDEYQLNVFTRSLTPKDILHVPIAHAEGRFVLSSGLLAEIQMHGLNVFQYCDQNGNIVDEFPINPNGSMNNIAAISNKSGNVMAMMPHPERTPNGDAIFASMRDYIKEGYIEAGAPLHYLPRPDAIVPYKPTHHELVIELIITDNHALSVENALNHKDVPVKIQRQIHWEIECDSLDTLEKIKSSGVLYNDRKERVVPHKIKQENATQFLIRPKEDLLGKEKQQLLENHFDITGIRSIKHAIVWQVVTNNPAHIDAVLNSHILYNPYAHDCYEY